ncbi:DMT family transporter [Chlamydiifrater phoenicopteri]|uniref:DMT family transporter n=1 Tax=Chlamydiifrater phoenicopteri TaxID=2681469 RepID=UPI001BCCA999|nr:DMT family transporter [Chlamydiifrater phoenicopteri]
MIADSDNALGKATSLKGCFYAISACFYWGIVFVIPAFLSHFHDTEIVLFRYSIYGLFSLATSVIYSRKIFYAFPKKIWIKAFIWSTIINPIYYLGIVAAIRLAGSAITVIIAGLTPVGVLVCANIRKRELPISLLFGIVIITTAGVVLSNVSEFHGEAVEGVLQKIIGIACVLASTAIWVAYVISNEKLVKCHKDMTPEIWGRMFGICALVVCIPLLIFCNYLGLTDTLNSFSSASTKDVYLFLALTTILGIFSSGQAINLWNKASLSLPSSVLGSMLVLEPLFGLVLSFLLVSKTTPSLIETTGILLMLTGSLAGTLLSEHGSAAHSESSIETLENNEFSEELVD